MTIDKSTQQVTDEAAYEVINDRQAERLIERDKMRERQMIRERRIRVWKKIGLGIAIGMVLGAIAAALQTLFGG